MTSTESLELDIDLRLRELWVEANTVREWNLASVAAFIRAAYGSGYTDALREPVRGSLCKDHGYTIPTRKCA